MTKIHKTDAQWRDELTEEQYRVLRGKATETPFSGQYVNKQADGVYSCAACGSMLFKSDDQYESTTPGLVGWPSFSDAANNDAIELKSDPSMGMQRTEVVCATCGGHLGHLFDDSSSPNNKHYCINSVSLNFKQQSESKK